MKGVVAVVIELLNAAQLPGLLQIIDYAGFDHAKARYPLALIGQFPETPKKNIGNSRQLREGKIQIALAVAVARETTKVLALNSARIWADKVRTVLQANPRLITATWPNGFALSSWTESANPTEDNFGGTQVAVADLILGVRYSEQP
jgi:hypothetical protein